MANSDRKGNPGINQLGVDAEAVHNQLSGKAEDIRPVVRSPALKQSGYRERG